jgi:hypothetical protein
LKILKAHTLINVSQHKNKTLLRRVAFLLAFKFTQTFNSM